MTKHSLGATRDPRTTWAAVSPQPRPSGHIQTTSLFLSEHRCCVFTDIFREFTTHSGTNCPRWCMYPMYPQGAKMIQNSSGNPSVL